MMNMLSPQAMGTGAIPSAAPPMANVPQPPPGIGQHQNNSRDPGQQTPLQIGQMPMQGENPVYHMPGQMYGGFAGGMMGQLGGYRNALMSWIQQRPQVAPGDPQGRFQAMQAWRQTRPDMFSFVGQGAVPGAPGVMPIMNPGQGPQMTPGGGVTGAPLQGNPAAQPQVGTQMGVIGATPAINGFGLPSY